MTIDIEPWLFLKAFHFFQTLDFFNGPEPGLILKPLQGFAGSKVSPFWVVFPWRNLYPCLEVNEWKEIPE
jgi:hypothetical protein